MTTKTNEMDDSYANGGYSPMPSAGMDVSLTLDQGGDYNDTQQVTVAEPEKVDLPPMSSSDIDPESVFLHAESITNATVSGGDSDMSHFDITFNITCTTPDTGISHTFRVVKRIAVDKMKMATEAKTTTPVTVVESKKTEKFVMNETTARWKQIAGIK